MDGSKITGDVRDMSRLDVVKASVAASNRIHHTFIPRNDPYDCYKPNSDDAVDILATSPINQTLVPEDVYLLRKVAADMDRTLITDEIENFPTNLDISEANREQLGRLPTWVRAMIKARWDLIHNHFGDDVTNFLKVIADVVNGQYKGHSAKVLGAPVVVDEDTETAEQINLSFYLENRDMEREPPVELAVKQNSVFLVSQAVSKWKALNRKRKYWETHMIKRAEHALRTAMITKASAADLAIIAEEEGTFAAESGDSEDESPQANKEKSHWSSFNICDKDVMKKEAKEAIDLEYHTKAESEITREERKTLKKRRKAVLAEHKKNTKVGCFSYIKRHPLFQSRKERKKKKQAIVERAVYRRYSRIWYKDCGEYIHHSKKVDHHYRFDEGLHQYVSALVTWSVFKTLIMFIIMANAILLALESGEVDRKQLTLFEILDLLFLTMYLVEFALKFYAHPYKYWRSGYNVFDFCILTVSLLKTIVDWFDSADELTFLRVLLIVRALRILRGVSLSVELQVLVTALAETLKTHVLSVVILLVLLMYIAAIVVYYLFSEKPGLEEWKIVGSGMLTMFTFVTMDGWTDITQDFQEANLFYQGRILGLICIVLGNFLFSNIFIAIIIMNISEATDAHRERQRNEREEVVARKKDIVFRRQKLDMRQLLARQKMSISADFFHMGCQFQRLLRHDDLVAMQEVCTSPLWMDCIYKTIHRCQYTSNLLLNLYREMADELYNCLNFYKEDKFRVPTIRRGLYNRYMLAKARLGIIKREIYRHRHPEEKPPLKIRLPHASGHFKNTLHLPKDLSRSDSNSTNSDDSVKSV